MSKPIIASSRVYNIIAQLDGGENPFDISGLDWPALRKAVRYGYLAPSRFRTGTNQRPAVVAYAITADGRDFLHRYEDAWEASVAS